MGISFKYIFLLCFISFGILFAQSKPKLAITMDDPNTSEYPLMSWQERNDKILETLKKHNLQAALFVCGKRIDDSAGAILLKKWDDAGHMLCNHTYSHAYFHSKKISLKDYEDDFFRMKIRS